MEKQQTENVLSVEEQIIDDCNNIIAAAITRCKEFVKNNRYDNTPADAIVKLEGERCDVVYSPSQKLYLLKNKEKPTVMKMPAKTLKDSICLWLADELTK